MSLYQTFVDYYDNIFPIKEPTLRFLEKNLGSSNHILDIGCATGSYAIALSENVKVDAFDLSEAMILKAKEKDIKNKVNFSVKNMLKLNDIAKYDGIYTIGNTLVHLTELSKIETFIDRVYAALNKRGTFILQIVNYDRIIKNNIDHLPNIDQDHVSFKRVYIKNPPLITFSTTLSTENETFHDNTPIYPLTLEEILIILTNQGFKDIEIFGDYMEEPFQIDTSFHLIITSKK